MKNLKTIVLGMFFLGVQLTQAQAPNWSINANEYQYTMTVTGLALFSCELSTNPNNQIGAFINGNLAGFVDVNTDVNGINYAYLIVYSNTASGETVSFKMYDATNDALLDAINTSSFEENQSIGSAMVPFEFQTDAKLDYISMSNLILVEDNVAGDSVSALRLINEFENEEVASYTFIDDADGVDNALFSFTANVLNLNQDVDFVNQSAYQIHVLATTPTGCTMDTVFNLSVVNTNDAPTDILPNPVSINENEGIGSLVTVLEAVDLSPNDSHVFILESDLVNFPDNALFSISGDELLSNEIYNYEEKEEYTLQLRVTDNLNNYYVDTFTVFIDDVIELEDLKANNVITPNGDGFNDFFTIPNVELFARYEFFVYNENGNLLFRRSASAGYNNRWDGTTIHGNQLPSGVYYFVLQDSESSNLFKGVINLIRN